MLGVIIPTYNRSDLLREALQSLVIQTYKRFFVCVVDDASTEDIGAVCKEFEDKLNIIHLRREKNEGPAAARNDGLRWAYRLKLEYIMFLDSDDLFYPNTIKVLSYEIKHTNSDVVIADVAQEDLLIESQRRETDDRIGIWCHGKIYRTAFLQQYNIWFPPVNTNEDVAFNFTINLITKKILKVNTELYLQRNYKHSMTREAGTRTYNTVRSIDLIDANFHAISQYVELCNKKIIKPSSESVVTNVMVLYNYYQTGKEVLGKIPDDIEEKMWWMLHLDFVQEYFSKPKNFLIIKKYIDPFEEIDGKIVFFKETFYEWYTRLGGKVCEGSNS